MHRLLERQLRKLRGAGICLPAEVLPLLDLVSSAYAEADADRLLLERSRELTSQELLEANDQLRRDVAELQAAKGLIRRQHEEIHQLIERSPDALVVHRDGRILFANGALRACLDCVEEELIGHPPRRGPRRPCGRRPSAILERAVPAPTRWRDRGARGVPGRDHRIRWAAGDDAGLPGRDRVPAPWPPRSTSRIVSSRSGCWQRGSRTRSTTRWRA